MKKLFKYHFILIFILGLITPVSSFTQNAADVIRVEDDKLVIRLDKRNKEEYDNLILYFGLNEDSLFQFGNIGPLAKEGWTLIKLDNNIAEIAKSLSADSKKFNWGNQPIFFDELVPPGEPGYPGPVSYGVNNYKKAANVYENEKGETIFLLNNNKATKVYLSGNFNNWDPSSIKMQKTNNGWEAKLNLKAGKYFYKFIVDDTWQSDENNTLNEPDGYGGFNSTYFRTNYSFTLKGYTDKKNVVVAGSFNYWNEKELKMLKTASGWRLDLFLAEGTHTYKFITDEDWILDPENKNVRDDGMGNFNSVIGLGASVNFILNGYSDAKKVILSGSFNNWNTGELIMEKITDGWQIPYVLAPGNYEYKFIVDGIWITDPGNPYKTGVIEIPNSVKVTNSNYTFTLKEFPDAKQVLLSGSFNNWAEPGYVMLRSDAGWVFPVYLSFGKHLYKYVVDGKWITDPGNPQYEENEFGTGNSVLWMEPHKIIIEK